MNHAACDFCGQALLANSEVRFELKIEIKAAYDPLDFAEEDLTKDVSAQIAQILRQLEGLSQEEAQNQVYRAFQYDVCSTCQRRLVHDHFARLKRDPEA